MTLRSHLDSLKHRHMTLEVRIADEGARPKPDGLVLRRMKVQRLRLKDEMDRVRRLI